ncbi:MAG: DUF3623 family protein [Alphaproteobacteria bacterium]|nr:DUF3623 family protein [Alphaproteobacteria bacterium]
MVDLAIAGLVALFVWWLATGVVMFAAWQSDRWQKWLMVVFTIGALAGCAGLYASAGMQSVTGTYLGFGSALAVWAWLEATFLFGLITGPRHSRCPGGARGLRRFRLAFLAVRDHELALLAGARLSPCSSPAGKTMRGFGPISCCGDAPQRQAEHLHGAPPRAC